jgi:hypothetical protein
MNLLIVVPDGVGIKNYLYSDFLEKLLQSPDFNVSIVTKLDTDFVRNLFDGVELNIYSSPTYRESVGELLLRESVKYARLKYFANRLKNHTILGAVSKGGTTAKKLLLTCTKWIGSLLFLSGYSSILAAEKRYWKLLSKKDLSDFQSLFRQVKPDIILTTHQRPVDNIPMYEMARRLGVKTTSVIYSWDNVSKAALNARADIYFIWSGNMLEQMKTFYPEIDERRIRITGTPQFSFYRNSLYHTSREVFCESFRIDPARKMVVFSGSDTRTSPYDPDLLNDVISVIKTMPVEDRPVLVFRRSPADFTGRYDAVLQQHPEIVSIDPLWINNGSSWVTAIPTRADIRNIVGLMQHCSLIINISSTMALDGAIFDKPSIYLAYAPESAPHFDYAKKIHVEDHLKVLRDIDGVAYVHKKEMLAQTIKGILEKPDEYCKDRKVFLKRVTDNIITEAADNMISELRSLVPQVQTME